MTILSDLNQDSFVVKAVLKKHVALETGIAKRALDVYNKWASICLQPNPCKQFLTVCNYWCWCVRVSN